MSLLKRQATENDVKYRVTLIESDEWSGPSSWTEDFDTFEQAEQRVTSVNARNVSPVAPSYYVQAKKKIEAVRVPVLPPGKGPRMSRPAGNPFAADSDPWMPDGRGLDPLSAEQAAAHQSEVHLRLSQRGKYPKPACGRGLGQLWTGKGSEVTCPACLEVVHA